MAPSNEDELADMMATGLAYKGPAFIRYPRGNAAGVPMKHYPEALTIGRAKRVRTGKTVDIWALGTILEDANKLCARLSEHGIEAGVVDARFAKPLDEEMLFASAEKHSLIITIEDHAVVGGFGTAVIEALHHSSYTCSVETIGWPDKFVEHGSSVEKLRTSVGLDIESILERVLVALKHVITDLEDAFGLATKTAKASLEQSKLAGSALIDPQFFAAFLRNHSEGVQGGSKQYLPERLIPLKAPQYFAWRHQR